MIILAINVAVGILLIAGAVRGQIFNDYPAPALGRLAVGMVGVGFILVVLFWVVDGEVKSDAFDRLIYLTLGAVGAVVLVLFGLYFSRLSEAAESDARVELGLPPSIVRAMGYISWLAAVVWSGVAVLLAVLDD